jgi:hypothetical protein
MLKSGPILAAILILSSAPARAVDSADAVCRLVAAAARSRDLPVAFLTRLVWRESSFRRDAVSPVGAQGIAQFMPGTAHERGLADPFDPEQAIPEAAALLSELRGHFGNLGLAAAAYNAGSARVAAWLGGHGALPAETEDYVRAVTGRPAEDWADRRPDPAQHDDPCPDTLAAIGRSLPAAAARSVLFAPWGVQLAGAFSRAAALAAYRRQQSLYATTLGDLQPMVVGGRKPGRGFRAFYQVRAPAASRAVAERLCGTLLKAGGACSVLRS